MPTPRRNELPNLHAIRAAILAAPPTPEGFPLQRLRDVGAVNEIREVVHLQQMLSDIRAEAQRAQSTPLEPIPFNLFHLFETTGERLSFERVYFDRHRRLAALAMATALAQPDDETDGYLVTLSDLIWEICNEYTWCLPAHLPVGIEAVKAYRVPPEQVVDLFAAHTAHALAETLSLLGRRLDPWLHYRVRSEIERRIFKPLFDEPRQFEWESAPTNWAAVCGGCVGMSALILENNRERLVGMIDRVIRTMACFLDGFGEDGGCAEGISYWVYGFGYYTYFAETLCAFTEGKIDLMQSDHVRNIAAFPQAVSLGYGKYINYSDAPEQAIIHPGLGSYLITRLGQTIPDLKPPDFHSDHIYRWGNITRDLLWTESALLYGTVTDHSTYLNDLGWVVDRRTLDGLTVAFSAKGGHNDEPHNHNDLGHFILHLGGESLLVDLGPGIYTRSYFSEGRYDSLHTGSQGHSVPFINGYTQQAGAGHAAKVLDCRIRSDGVDFVLELAHTYDDPALESFVRAFYWTVNTGVDSATLTLVDAFKFVRLPTVIEECFVSLVRPSVRNGIVRWEGHQGVITLSYDSRRHQVAVDALETQTHQAKPGTVYRVRLRSVKDNLSKEDAFEFVCHLNQLGAVLLDEC